LRSIGRRASSEARSPQKIAVVSNGPQRAAVGQYGAQLVLIRQVDAGLQLALPFLISTTVCASQATASRFVGKVLECRCRSPLGPGAK
jgi:hypothetical protein